MNGGIELELGGGARAVLPVRRSSRARRMTLRLLEDQGTVELVLPRRASVAAGKRFVAAKLEWIIARMEDLPQRVPFAEGAVIPVLGEPVILRRLPSGVLPFGRMDGYFYLQGAEEGHAEQTRRWLIEEAHRAIVPRAHAMAERIGHTITRIGLRDPRTRWGSCSSDGNLSFSWRLVLAPAPVLDYVVAHEVAHLAHLDHSPAFWAIATELAEDTGSSRAWLRENGARLRRYG